MTGGQEADFAMRSFVSGAVLAALISAVVLATLSLMGEQPAGRLPPQTPQQDVAAAPQSDGAAPPLPAPPAEVTPIGANPEAQTPPDAAAATADAPLDPAAQVAAPVPETASVEAAISSPGAPQGALPQAEDVSPVLPNPQTLTPQPPATETGPAVATDPATPAQQGVVAPELTAPAPAAEAPAAGSAPDAAPGPDQGPALAPPPSEDAAPVTAPGGAPAAQVPAGGAPAAQVPAGDAPAAQVPAGDAPAAPPPVMVELQGSSATLPGGSANVTIRRPATAATPEADSLADTAVPAAEPAAGPAAGPADDRPALERFAATFDNPSDLPLIAVLLVDDGSMPGSVAAVVSTGMPVTVVIDAGQPDAAGLMADYRAAGIEVAAMTRLPFAARPADAEVTMAAAFASLTQATALVDLGQSGLQADRQVTDQVMSILSDTGRGFVTLSSGLNLAVRAAEQADVPNAVVYRDLDNLDQDSRAIRRFMDQAAFRARQDGEVVMLGRVRPDTISALVLWGTANRATQVAVAPLSALLERLGG